MNKSTQQLTPTPELNISQAAYEREIWIYTGVSASLAILTLYICITQIIYCIKMAGCSNERSPRPSAQKSTRNWHAFTLNMLLAVASLCTFLRTTVDFRIIYGLNNDTGCDLSVKFKVANHSIAFLCIYLVLWLRQRSFYRHPALRYLFSKFVRVISWSMSIVVVSGVVIASGFFFAVGKYVSSVNGCILSDGPFTMVRWIVMVACTTFFHIFLLPLFIYPLIKNRANRIGDITSREGSDRVISLVQRATIISILCVLADFVCALVVLILDDPIVTMSIFLYDVHLVFTNMCIIFSFPNWKSRMLPFPCSARHHESNEGDRVGESQQVETGSHSTQL